MTTPYDPYASATSALPNATVNQIPAAIVGQFSSTINTSDINFSSVNGGIFGYQGLPAANNLSFALSPSGGTDGFGNSFPSGILVAGGSIQSASIVGATIDQTTSLVGSQLQNVNVLNPSVSGGTAAALVHTMQDGNGGVLGYTSGGSASATFTTNGLWTAPTGVTSVRVQCWGAGGGGGGSNSAQGGPGGGAGEYAEEPSYAVTPGAVYQVIVGQGGFGGATQQGGGNGGQTEFIPVAPGTGISVIANGGLTTQGQYSGGPGGSGSGNTIHFSGGNGADSTGQTGGAGGGSSASPAGQGNPGAGATSGTGGAGGAALTGGGAGGAGGNNGGNGVNAGAPGGGGGGGGSTSGLAFTNTYGSLGTWAYFGSDASTPNALKNHDGPMYQGQPSGSTGQIWGHTYSYVLLNYAKIESDLSGVTVTSVEVKLTNQSSYYSSGMYVNLRYSSRSTFGSTGDGGVGTNVKNFFIARGATYNENVGLGGNIGVALQNGSAKSLLVGPTNDQEGLWYYGSFAGSGDITLTVNYVTGTSTTAGAGADGQVILTYQAGSAPVFQLSVAAVSGADLFGNPYNAGFAGPNFVAPGSASTVATLNSGGLTVQTASNSGTVGSSATPSGLNGQQLILFGQSSAPALSANGTVAFSTSSGDLKYVQTADGNAYNTGRITIPTTGTVTINSTTNISIVSGTFAAGKYRFKAMLIYVGQGSSGISNISFTGSVTTSEVVGLVTFNDTGSAFNTYVINGTGSPFPGPYGGPSLVNTGLFCCTLEGFIVFSGGGTFGIVGKISSGGSNYAIATGSFLEMEPVS